MANLVSGKRTITWYGATAGISGSTVDANVRRVYSYQTFNSGPSSVLSYTPHPSGTFNTFSQFVSGGCYGLEVITSGFVLAGALQPGDYSGTVPKCGVLRRGGQFAFYRGINSYDLDASGSVFNSNNTVEIRQSVSGAYTQKWVPGGGANDFTLLASGCSGSAYLVVTKHAFLCPVLAPVDASIGITHGTGQTDTATDMAAAYTHVSRQSGNWNDSSTWAGGGVPGSGASVRVESGHRVVYNQNDTTTPLYAVGVQGTLAWDASMTTAMLVRHAHVYQNGTMTIGTSGSPVSGGGRTARLIFKDTRWLETQLDPEQWNHGLTVFGRFESRGEFKTPFVRCSGPLVSGQMTVGLAATPVNWKSGDHIVIPDSRQPVGGSTGFLYTPHFCQLSDTPGGVMLSLSSGLRHAHPGAEDENGVEVSGLFPHVANLTRNVRFESESDLGDGVGGGGGGIGTPPTTTLGHTTVLHHGNVHTYYTEYRGMGRTRFTDGSNPDNSTYDSLGNVTYVGRNQIGKYAIHLHHAEGMSNGDPSGYQNEIVGCSFVRLFGGNTPKDERWPLTIHDTAFNLIKDNVIYNGAGAGIALEQGHETENLIDGNFVCHIGGNGGNDGTGNSGDGIWSVAMQNRFNNNVMTNVPAISNNDYGHGYRFDLRNIQNSDVRTYTTPGNHGEFEVDNATSNMVLSFDNNEVYGCNSGLTNWQIGQRAFQPWRTGRMGTVSNFKMWSLVQHPFYIYPCHGLVLDSVKFYGWHTDRADGDMTAELFRNPDYEVTRFTTSNCVFSGLRVGVVMPPNVLYADWTTPTIECVNTVIATSNITGAFVVVGPHRVVSEGSRASCAENMVLRNCTRVALKGATVPYLNYVGVPQGTAGDKSTNLLRVKVHDAMGVSGRNYQTYEVAQSPSSGMYGTNTAIIPDFWGAETSGATNQNQFDNHSGLCTWGELLPAGTITVSGMGDKVRVTSGVDAYSAPGVDSVFALFSGRLSVNLRASSGLYEAFPLEHSAFGKSIPPSGGVCGYWQGRDWRDTQVLLSTSGWSFSSGNPPFMYCPSDASVGNKPVLQCNGSGAPVVCDAGVRKNWTFLVLCRPDRIGGLYGSATFGPGGMMLWSDHSDASVSGGKVCLMYRQGFGGNSFRSSGSTKSFGEWVMFVARKQNAVYDVWQYSGGGLATLGTASGGWVSGYQAMEGVLNVDLTFDQGVEFSKFRGRLAHMIFLNRGLSNVECEALADQVASDWSYTG